MLYTLAGHIPSDGCVFALAGDFVDLIHIDDTPLRQLYVKVCRLKQTQEDILHIVAYIAGLRKSGGIGNGEGHLQHPSQSLGKQGFAAAGGADHEDVALLQLHILTAAVKDAFIVVIYGHGEGDFRSLLPDDIFVQHRLDFPGSGQTIRRFEFVFRSWAVIILQNGHTQLDALVADPDAGALDHAVYLIFALATERAVELFVFFRHVYLL